MNLKKLFEMQKALDDRIIKEHGLEGQDLLPKKILALQVELGECANEWRGFKMWSKDQEPRTKVKCTNCQGSGEILSTHEGDWITCEWCEGTKVENNSNPLLEEYVDCLHFFLSLAHTIDIPEDELDLNDFVIEGSTATVFTDIISAVGLLETDTKAFDDAWKSFLLLGTERLGFTFEQIEAAYMDKNKTNHERQANGY